MQTVLRRSQFWGLCSNSVRATACPGTPNADYRSLLVYTPTAHTRSGQSERHVPLTPIRTPERLSHLGGQIRIVGTEPRATPKHELASLQHRSESCIFPNTFSHIIYPIFAIVLAILWIIKFNQYPLLYTLTIYALSNIKESERLSSKFKPNCKLQKSYPVELICNN